MKIMHSNSQKNKNKYKKFFRNVSYFKLFINIIIKFSFLLIFDYFLKLLTIDCDTNVLFAPFFSWKWIKSLFIYLININSGFVVRYHVSQADTLLKKWGFTSKTNTPLQKAEKIKALDALADQKRNFYGYDTDISMPFYDDVDKKLVFYCCDYDKENPKIRGVYREAYRTEVPPIAVFHPNLVAYIQQLRKKHNQINR